MAKTRNYLSESEIEEVYDTLSRLFGEEFNNQINLNELRNELDKIISKVNLISKKRFSHSKNKYVWTQEYIKRTSYEKRKLMAETYLIIFKVRAFLLQEDINYRYYYDTEDGGAKVVSFTDKDLLKYVRASRYGLQILDNILKKQETDQEYQHLLDLHQQNLWRGLQQANDSSFWIVHSNIMEKYGPAGLRNKKTNRYQVFTKGHIFEAMDIAFADAIDSQNIENYEYIETAMFSKYLNYDSIPGTKGGDNAITNTSIKANSADLMDYSTLYKDLLLIKNMLELKNPNEIKKIIKDLFISEEKYQSVDAMEKAIDQAVDRLLKLLKVDNK